MPSAELPGRHRAARCRSRRAERGAGRQSALRRRALAKERIKLLVEPINTLDIPGFFLNRTEQAVQLIADVRSSNLFIQYDIYHMQVMEGDIARTVQKHLPPHRAYPACRQSRPQRAGHRRDQLSFPVPPSRHDRLSRLGRLRIQATDDDGRRPRMARGTHARYLRGMSDMTNIGFIGLGIMGRPMAGHLQAAGHRLFLHDVGPSRRSWSRPAASPASRAGRWREESEVVIIMVPDTPHVEAVLFGPARRCGRHFERQDRRRHELDLADRHQGVREEDRGARRGLSRRAGFRRRGRRQGGEPHHHGRWPRRAHSTR